MILRRRRRRITVGHVCVCHFKISKMEPETASIYPCSHFSKPLRQEDRMAKIHLKAGSDIDLKNKHQTRQRRQTDGHDTH